MKKYSKLIAVVAAVCVILSVSALAAEPTWEDYQNYLVEAAGGNAPDLAEFQAQVDAIGSWDEMPLDESPWDQIFSMLGISTWEEFVEAGGVGAVSKETGSYASGDASGEASGESSGDPSGEGSGEPSGEGVVPGTYSDGELTLVIADDMTFSMDKTGQNMEGEDFVLTVKGTVTEDGVFTITGLLDGDFDLIEVASEEQIAGDLATVESVYAAAAAAGDAADAAPDTSEEAYHAYLKEFVDAVPAVNDEQFLEFAALIDASDYQTMPADMMFNPQWWGYAAMTYDEFVAAGGVYEIPPFDPNLAPD